MNNNINIFKMTTFGLINLQLSNSGGSYDSDMFSEYKS